MASSAPTLLLLLLGFLVFTAKAGPGGRLGGKTEIEDVKRNEEVQALGRYCVEEEQGRGRKGALSFTEVTEAQKQVVAGTKYYLRISAAEDGVRKSFDAVVVVKPWLRSKQLVSFAPSNSDR